MGAPMKIHDVVFVYHLDDEKLLDWHSRVHSHEDNLFEFHYFIAGRGQFKNGDNTRAITPGSLFLTYPHQIHGICPDAEAQALTYYAVLFEFHQARDAPMVDIFDPRISTGFPMHLDTTTRLKFADIKNRYNSNNQFFSLSAELELTGFFFSLMGMVLEGKRTSGADSSGSDLHVAMAVQIFQDRVHENLKMTEVAKALKISETWFIKVFKERMGVPPAKYFHELKLEVASSLLLNTTLSIKEIAWRLNYSSQYHFSRNFSQFAQISPRDYRLRYLSDNPTSYLTKIIPRLPEDSELGS